jgi:single-stranded DNA-binding protein
MSKVNYQEHTVIGNLAADVKSTEKVANFSVAVDTGYGDNKSVHFFNMTAFPRTFTEKVWGVLTRLKKGTNILVKYEESDGSYEKDGKKVRDVKRVVSSFKLFFGEKKEGAEGETAAASTSAPKAAKTGAKPASTPASNEPEVDDDIPF